MTTDLFKWRHSQAEIILTCVCWYLRYSLSYRDLEEMMTERGRSVDHSTIFWWVQDYSPELDKRSRPYLKKTNDSWSPFPYVRIVISGLYVFWRSAAWPLAFVARHQGL